MGREMITEDAANIGQSVSLKEEESVATSGVSITVLPEVNMTGKNRSFQHNIKVKIAVAAIPGEEAGITIRRIDDNLEHPSIIAASSRERGMASKKLVIIHTL